MYTAAGLIAAILFQAIMNNYFTQPPGGDWDARHSHVVHVYFGTFVTCEGFRRYKHANRARHQYHSTLIHRFKYAIGWKLLCFASRRAWPWNLILYDKFSSAIKSGISIELSKHKLPRWGCDCLQKQIKYSLKNQLKCCIMSDGPPVLPLHIQMCRMFWDTQINRRSHCLSFSLYSVLERAAPGFFMFSLLLCRRAWAEELKEHDLLCSSPQVTLAFLLLNIQ